MTASAVTWRLDDNTIFRRPLRPLTPVLAGPADTTVHTGLLEVANRRMR